MHRNPWINKAVFVHSLRLLRVIHPGSFFTAVLLALIIGSAGLPPSALAAPDDPSDVSFELDITPQHPPVLCLTGNKELKIYASINKSVTKSINGKERVLPRGKVTGVNIKSSQSVEIGTLVPANTSTYFSTAEEDGNETAPLKPKGMGEADFLFTAKKAGTTTLSFTSQVPGEWTGATDPVARAKSYPAKKAEITVKVIRSCKYKVETKTRFPANGKLNPLIIAPAITARIEEAELTADANGRFSGSGTVQWFGGTKVSSLGEISCTVTENFSATSKVDLTGEISDDGQLTLNLTYDRVDSHLTETCSVATVSSDLPYILDSIKITLPATGGSLSLSQGYDQEFIVGPADISVTPEEDTAVSYHPVGQGEN